MRKLLHDMVESKEYTNYDIHQHLRKHKGEAYKSPNELADEEGVLPQVLRLCRVLERGATSIINSYTPAERG